MFFVYRHCIMAVIYLLGLSLLLVSPISRATYYDQQGVSKSEIEKIVDTVYAVDPTDLSLTVTEGKANKMDSVAWQKLTYLLPSDILKDKVREYKVFTDGLEGAFAYVNNSRKSQYQNKWVFGVDYEDANGTNITPFVSTVIHEFSHILSLSEDQVIRKFNHCSTYKIEEGCNKENSYLNTFYNTFWHNDQHQEYQEELAELSDSQQEVATADFYEQHRDNFVSEYSATNPVEDFAETFPYFVLGDKIANPTTIKEQKINFFYQFPELVKVRSYIRKRTDIRKAIDD